ncbi:hypothetical protein CEV34_3298 [Brucella pseudogrignonensis]|uniref:Uncharacterized protein n=1 Tax=Brucella pseudogrignonensis TaxID=419475 RepID=A0A256GA14_9HYPH|nr:hypothetical protein CEV34_3298 [Brucella pseudogrignonensis]
MGLKSGGRPINHSLVPLALSSRISDNLREGQGGDCIALHHEEV